ESQNPALGKCSDDALAADDTLAAEVFDLLLAVLWCLLPLRSIAYGLLLLPSSSIYGLMLLPSSSIYGMLLLSSTAIYRHGLLLLPSSSNCRLRYIYVHINVVCGVPYSLNEQRTSTQDEVEIEQRKAIQEVQLSIENERYAAEQVMTDSHLVIFEVCKHRRRQIDGQIDV
ncbi:hypothetical protein Taro_046427, partial [Colocasia esculenta]|nr:hypothetical protein [Colocasia esculenta]